MAWQVGDLAVCVAVEHPLLDGRSTLLKVGAIYTVTKAGTGHTPRGHIPLPALQLAEVSPRKYNAWPADCFRKVVRDKHEACEPEFVTLLKRAKRSVEA